MTRDAKSPTALIALARTRRMQRALAHAYLHRGAPMPTLRTSLGYMTNTACVADDDAQRGHRMSVLGLARAEGVAYVVEELGGLEDTPIVYRLWLRGPRHGHLVPVHAWYEHDDDAVAIRARIADLAPGLAPVEPAAPEAWMLSTRIVQRRALRVGRPGACPDLPIRKFALQLLIEPVTGEPVSGAPVSGEPVTGAPVSGGRGASGRTTVTAFLRPHAELAEVWSIGDGEALARVTYTGIPSGPGLAKDTVVLLTPGLGIG